MRRESEIGGTGLPESSDKSMHVGILLRGLVGAIILLVGGVGGLITNWGQTRLLFICIIMALVGAALLIWEAFYYRENVRRR